MFYLSNLTVYASADASGLNKQQSNRHNIDKEKIIKHEIKSHNSKNNQKDNDNDPKDDESKIKLSSNEYQSISNSLRHDYGNPKYNGNFRKPLNRNREEEKVPRVKSGAESENDEKIEHLMNQKLQVKSFF